MSLLPPETTLAILASRKLGHAMQCEGVARALGVAPEIRLVRPRKLFHIMSPVGPVDPRDKKDVSGAALRPPFPDIVLASGRETIPYLRAMKRLSGRRTFTVYLGDPHMPRFLFDLICVPEHDELHGKNIVATLTSPHPRDEAMRNAARANPDARIAALATPRVAMLIGGPSIQYKFESRDIEAVARIADDILASGASLMISPSRRTPETLVEALRKIAQGGNTQRVFLWDGHGENPYVSMLAFADAFLVTADSVSMIGETAATGKPIHIYEPSGHAGKFKLFIQQLFKRGIARPWSGKIESWSYEPLDLTPEIAREIATRFAGFAARRR